MIPLIIIGSSESAQAYCDDYTATNKIPSYALHIVLKEKAHLSIAEIRGISQLLLQYRGTPQCMIIRDFDTATIEAQNALLKTLEEIDPHHHLLLCCSRAETIVPTIVSRCKQIFLPGEQDQYEHIELSPSTLIQTSANHKAPLSLATNIIVTFSQKMRVKPTLQGVTVLHSLLEVYSAMKRNNVNAELSLDEMYFLLEETKS